MYGKKDDSKKITIAVVSLCLVVLFLSVFTVNVYKGKRTLSDDSLYPSIGGDVSQPEVVSPADEPTVSQEPVNSEDTASDSPSSQNTDVSSVSEETGKNEDILNPDFKSDYYMVAYIGSQTVVVYKKDSSGQYTEKFHAMQCSTGDADKSPTMEGVYSIDEKKKWSKLTDEKYGQYTCHITSSDKAYYISSLSYRKKTAWTMLDNTYENIGKPVTQGDIQLCVRDAYWIYTNMPKETQINVVNKEAPEVKLTELPKKIKKNGGWDPTDKWAKGNPYFG